MLPPTVQSQKVFFPLHLFRPGQRPLPLTLFNSMNGVIAPSSGYLPDELMSLVFLNCLEPDDIGCVIPSSSSAPLTLSWVCRRWRRICLSTPQLWTGIGVQDLTQDGSRMVDRTAVLNLLDIWISRSRSCPLSIRFSYTELSEEERSGMMLFLPENDENSAYMQDVKALTDKLLCCQHRWRALDVTVLDLSVAEPLLRAVSVQPASPLLEHLRVSTKYLGIFGEVRVYNLALSSHLRTIRIMSPLIVPETTGVQFERLTELTLKYCSSMEGCLQWIDMAPNLEILKVGFFGSEADQIASETRVRRLNKLKSLHISSFSSDSDPEAFMNILELPALNELYLSMNDLIESRSWSCVVDMLKRSRPKALEGLMLLGTPMNTDHILECLRMSPRLTYLNLGSVTDTVLGALSASTSHRSDLVEPLCPRLEVMEFDDTDGCTHSSLIDFVSSRYRGKENSMMALLGDEYGPLGDGGDQWRTLRAMVLPHDPERAFIKHPKVAQCIKKGLDVTYRAPAFEILPADGTARPTRRFQ